MRLLLDTHVWVRWINRPEKLTRAQRSAIDRTRRRGDEPLLLSIISCWEVALLHELGKLRFTFPVDVWLQQAASLPGLDVVPITLPIVVTASRLLALRDPADMLIVATAQQHGARLVTSDTRIEASKAVQVIC